MKKKCSKCLKTRDIKFFENPRVRICIDCKKRAKRLKRLNSTSFLKDKAWKSFSRYIRTRDSLKTTKSVHYCVCLTCSNTTEYKKIQAGHFIGGRGNSVLFDERIVNGQCFRCNIKLSGNYDSYNLIMLEKYGADEVIKMLKQKNKTVKYTANDFRDIKDKYDIKYKKLLKKKEV